MIVWLVGTTGAGGTGVVGVVGGGPGGLGGRKGSGICITILPLSIQGAVEVVAQGTKKGKVRRVAKKKSVIL